MLCRARMPRKRKPGPRAKSGRPSRAFTGAARDTGTREGRAKRAALINGADPQLAASASGILLANGFLTQRQHAAALVYAWAHALTYGKPWRQACPLGDRTGRAPSDARLVKAKAKLARTAAGRRQRRGVRLHTTMVLRRSAQAAIAARRCRRARCAAGRARCAGEALSARQARRQQANDRNMPRCSMRRLL